MELPDLYKNIYTCVYIYDVYIYIHIIWNPIQKVLGRCCSALGRASLPGLRTGSVALQPPSAPSAPLAHEPGMDRTGAFRTFFGTSIVIQFYECYLFLEEYIKIHGYHVIIH